MKFKKGDIVSPGHNHYKVVRSYYKPDDFEGKFEYVDLIDIEDGNFYKQIYDPGLKLIKRKQTGHHLTSIFK